MVDTLFGRAPVALTIAALALVPVAAGCSVETDGSLEADESESAEAALASVTVNGTMTIQAQDFGNTKSDYSDTTPTINLAVASGSVGNCRNNNAVDIQTKKNDPTGGGCNIGWTAPGEWLKYPLNVTAPGTYRLKIRVASNTNGGTILATISGEATPIERRFTVGGTGGWQNWTTTEPSETFKLGAGARTMKIAFETGGYNVAYYQLEKVDDIGTPDEPPGTPPPSASPVPTSTCASVVSTALDDKPLADLVDPKSSGLTVRTVGTGTPASCTHAALEAAVTAGGFIKFNCGSDPATIQIQSEITAPSNIDTVIDGEGKITLDAGKRTRMFKKWDGWFRNNATTPLTPSQYTKLALQRLKLINAKPALGTYYPQDPTNPECAWGYDRQASGGVVYVRNRRLHVVECEFSNNESAPVGPDVGGGAIAVEASLDVQVVRSKFVGNQASNAGAVYLLSSNGRFVDSLFENNKSTGTGMNYRLDGAGCGKRLPGGHMDQAGAGGNGGAVVSDGLTGSNVTMFFCGTVFRGNETTELGTVFRTPDAGGTGETVNITQSTFDANSARQAVIGFFKQVHVVASQSTFSNNVATGNSALQLSASTFEIANSTFYANKNNGNLLSDLYAGGTVKNATFAKNRSSDLFSRDSVTVDNSLFWDNTCGSSPRSGSNNVQYLGNACVTGVTWGDPMLGELADNGPPTKTMLPGVGSAARGKGAGCLTTEQRPGHARSAGTCTVGAVEP